MTKAAQAAGAQVLIVGMQVPPNYGSDYTQRFDGDVSRRSRAPTRTPVWCPSC